MVAQKLGWAAYLDKHRKSVNAALIIDKAILTRLSLKHTSLNRFDYSQASFCRTASRLIVAKEGKTFIPACYQALFILNSAQTAEATDKKHDRAAMHICEPVD